MNFTQPTPWREEWEDEPGEFGTILNRAFRGIVDAKGDWVIRFDDDYGTDQLATAREIISLVNTVANAQRWDDKISHEAAQEERP